MYRMLLLFVAGLTAVFSGLAAKPLVKVENAARAPGVVKEVGLDGLKQLLARDRKNPRPLLINFWATWCIPCREEFPDLLQVRADYEKRGVEVIFVSLDDPTDIKTVVPQFLREVGAEKFSSYLLNVPDPEPAIKLVDVEWRGALPATFLYDTDGKIVFKHTGRIKLEELRPALDKVVK